MEATTPQQTYPGWEKVECPETFLLHIDMTYRFHVGGSHWEISIVSSLPQLLFLTSHPSFNWHKIKSLSQYWGKEFSRRMLRTGWIPLCSACVAAVDGVKDAAQETISSRGRWRRGDGVSFPDALPRACTHSL